MMTIKRYIYISSLSMGLYIFVLMQNTGRYDKYLQKAEVT